MYYVQCLNVFLEFWLVFADFFAYILAVVHAKSEKRIIWMNGSVVKKLPHIEYIDFLLLMGV